MRKVWEGNARSTGLDDTATNIFALIWTSLVSARSGARSKSRASPCHTQSSNGRDCFHPDGFTISIRAARGPAGAVRAQMRNDRFSERGKNCNHHRRQAAKTCDRRNVPPEWGRFFLYLVIGGSRPQHGLSQPGIGCVLVTFSFNPKKRGLGGQSRSSGTCGFLLFCGSSTPGKPGLRAGGYSVQRGACD